MTPGDIIACPQAGCDQPAEIMHSYLLRSTSGPVEMVTMQCIGRHWFNFAASDVAAAQEITADWPVKCCPGGNCCCPLECNCSCQLCSCSSNPAPPPQPQEMTYG